MKLYYNPIELPELTKDKQTADPKVDSWPTREKFDLVNSRVAEELNRIQSGTSELLNYPRYFQGKEPVMMKFNQLKLDPTKRNWVDFMILAEQDLGKKAADQFEKWYGLIFTDTVTYKEEQV